MKIYFSGSIRGGRDDAGIYRKIISFLKEKGDVLTEHIGDPNLSSAGQSELDDKDIHDKDMDFIFQSDIVIAEVTNPSLGVGYEIGRAIDNNKRVVCLFRIQNDKRLSAMISGSKEIELIEYDSFKALKISLEKVF